MMAYFLLRQSVTVLKLKKNSRFLHCLPVQIQICVRFPFWKKVDVAHQIQINKVCGTVDSQHSAITLTTSIGSMSVRHGKQTIVNNHMANP